MDADVTATAARIAIDRADFAARLGEIIEDAQRDLLGSGDVDLTVLRMRARVFPLIGSMLASYAPTGPRPDARVSAAAEEILSTLRDRLRLIPPE